MPEQKISRMLNRNALSRIFGNIINNAVKYSDGDLVITLTEDGKITFTNHASQLDEIKVGRLFDRSLHCGDCLSRIDRTRALYRKSADRADGRGNFG